MSLMQGKTVVVTGATGGIGFIAAREIAKQGARVLLAVRDVQKGEAAVGDIRRAAGHDRVELVQTDFASMASIRNGAEEIARRVDVVDVLLNNAGAMYQTRKQTADGLEMTFGVNHIGYFLMTNLLLPKLQAAPAARVVSVSSEAHRAGRVRFDDLNSERGYRAFPAYGTSKLMNILFTRELARRLSSTKVTANCLHPGVVATGFGQNDGGLFKLAVKIGGFFMISADEGARTSVYLSTSPDVQGKSGGYYDKCKLKTPTKAAQSDADAQRLWEVSAKITGVGA